MCTSTCPEIDAFRGSLLIVLMVYRSGSPCEIRSMKSEINHVERELEKERAASERARERVGTCLFEGEKHASASEYTMGNKNGAARPLLATTTKWRCAKSISIRLAHVPHLDPNGIVFVLCYFLYSIPATRACITNRSKYLKILERPKPQLPSNRQPNCTRCQVK